MITAMILAGGNGTRVGADRPKQFVEIQNRPILAYTVDIYQKNPNVDTIEIVCHRDWINYVKNMIDTERQSKVRWIVSGGDTFLESVICGVNELKKHLTEDDMVMIHYGASPLTSQEILNDSIKVCRAHRMSVSCTPCYQLLGSNESNISSSKWIDRDKITQICCPQSFKFSYLLELYEKGKKQGLLEVVEPHITSLMYALGEQIYQSYGNQTNIKITTREDIDLFRAVVKSINGGVSQSLCKPPN